VLRIAEVDQRVQAIDGFGDHVASPQFYVRQ
jgi:hypothetical protein